jgi:hypothetical protein
MSVITKVATCNTKEDGAIGTDNLDRWPLSSNAVTFLSAAESIASAAELREVYYFLPFHPFRDLPCQLQHPLLARPWQKESLIGIMYARALQACTTGEISELAMGFVFQKTLILIPFDSYPHLLPKCLRG